jgi:hypothetical protein
VAVVVVAVTMVGEEELSLELAVLMRSLLTDE